MPGQHHRHWWLYVNLKPNPFSHVGKIFYGIVWGRRNWPVLAVFIDDSWYEPATSFGLNIGFLEIGVFIEHVPRGQRDWKSRPRA